MQPTFTLHEDSWFNDLPFIQKNRQVIGYRVSGMPDGTTVRIANFGAPIGNDWRIMLVKSDDNHSGWTGHYESAEEALNVLKNQLKI